MALNSCKWLKKKLKMVGNGGKELEMAVNDFKWLKMAVNAVLGCKWMEKNKTDVNGL